MKRSTGPWLRKGRGWYVEIDGKQWKLAPATTTKEEAVREWHKLMAAPIVASATRSRSGDELGLSELCDRFLAWLEQNRSSRTYSWYAGYLKKFCERFDDKPATEVIAYDVTQYADSKKATQWHRRAIYTVIKRAYRWGEEVGLLDRNPLARLKVSTGPIRERVLSKTEIQQILFAAKSLSQQAHDYFRIIHLTGCRPFEAESMESRHVDRDGRRWILETVGSKGKKKNCVVYCGAEAWAIVERLMRESGPVLRPSRGDRWTQSALFHLSQNLRTETNISIGPKKLFEVQRQNF